MENYKNLPIDEKRKLWLQDIESWGKSGLTQSEFCKINNIKLSTFTSRRKSLGKRFKKNKLAQIPPKTVQNSITNNSSMELEIKNLLTVKINHDFNPDLLKKLLETLGVTL